jgi:DNA (cytosine-5)-methyltransferase 1
MAGFYVVGVDVNPQPHYCGDAFYQADALSFPLDGFDAYHASPPCQAYSVAFSPLLGHKKMHPDLINLFRERLKQTNKPFVIENVPNAPLFNYIELDGTMFGLHTKKERWFELHGFDILMLPAKLLNTSGMVKNGELTGLMQHSQYPKEVRANKENLAAAYGIDWTMTRHELRQAIPPAYTEFIGRHLLEAIKKQLRGEGK